MAADTTIEGHLGRIEKDGFTILENVIDEGLVGALLADVDRLERDLAIRPATNEFEGTRTHRVYNLLAHGDLWACVPVHQAVLPVVERVLDPGCLISSLSSIAIEAGETEQLLHADDQLIPIARPHAALVCNTMWALTDFTEENGATRLVPGSHRSDRTPGFGEEVETIAAEMSAGSVLIWNGSLWHGGGANRTSARRVGVAMNYCAGFLRQQENQQLGLSRDTVRGFSPRLRELVGYGVYNNLIGHIDRRNPAGLLGDEDRMRMVWEG